MSASPSTTTALGVCRICTSSRDVHAIDVIGDAPATVCRTCSAERFREVAR